MDHVLTGAIGATLLAVADNSVPHLAEHGQSLDVDMNQVTGPLPFVAPHKRLGLQVSQTVESKTVQSTGERGERRLEQAGDVPEVQTLVTAVDNLLQLRRIKRQTVAAANTASIPERPNLLSGSGRASGRRSIG